MKHFTKVLPILSIALALILDIVLPDNLQHPAAEHPYFIRLLGAALVVYLIFYAVSFFRPSLREKLEYKAYFYAGAALFLNILNLLTVKFAILPVLYFPSLDRVFGVLFEDSAFLAKCLAYSARLLFIGWFCGAIVGMLTGIAIGFNKTFSYWVQPLVRVLGPIPSTAWIPIVLIAFPSAVSASAFLIALAVWFPTTVLTSSGIAAIPNAYFEVSSTLGAGSLYRIVMVGSISISGVSKHFINPSGERITALDNVSLDIPAGSFVSLIGPSGCGKSTLLRLISGLIPMDDGSLTLDETGAGETADTTADGQDAVPETVENNDALADDTAPAEQPAA